MNDRIEPGNVSMTPKRGGKRWVVTARSMVIAIVFSWSCSLLAASYYVNNQGGDDRNDGSQSLPFKTIAKALSVLEGGDELHLKPNAEPYFEGLVLREEKFSGSEKNPTLIDGHGATVSSLLHYPEDRWKSEGDDVFSVKLQNNAWVMDAQGYWSGFPIVFIDGQPLDWVKGRDSLSENTYLLYKESHGNRGPLHNTMYVKLAAGKTPADVEIRMPADGGCGTVGVSHVVIRNIVSTYTISDGFFTCWGGGIVFDNVWAHHNMDQGISNHSAKVVVRNSTFSQNAGCGIVDINMNEKVQCEVTYINCLVEDDVFRGGVEFHGGTFEMIDCIIRNNPKKGVEVNKGATVRLVNTLIYGGERHANGIMFGGDNLDIVRCTVARVGTGLTVGLWRGDGRLTMTNSAFIESRLAYRINTPVKEGLTLDFESDYNVFTPSPFHVFGKEYTASKFDKFVRETGYEQHSTLHEYTGAMPPMNLPAFAVNGKDDSVIGANLDSETTCGYKPPPRD